MQRYLSNFESPLLQEIETQALLRPRGVVGQIDAFQEDLLQVFAVILLPLQLHHELRSELVVAKIHSAHKGTRGASPEGFQGLSVVQVEPSQDNPVYCIFQHQVFEFGLASDLLCGFGVDFYLGPGRVKLSGVNGGTPFRLGDGTCFSFENGPYRYPLRLAERAFLEIRQLFGAFIGN